MSRHETSRRAGSALLLRQEGLAVVVAVITLLLMAGVATALVLSTSTEALVASNFRSATESTYAADAAIEIAAGALPSITDWNTVLDGSVRSAFVDGAPGGTRVLADGTTLDIGQVINRANCAKPSPCTEAEMGAVTRERPWGPNNPRWQPFAYGRLSDVLAPSAVNSPFYVLVLVADDPSETDGDPTRDGIAGSAGAGVVSLRAEAFGGRGAHRTVEATIARPAGAAAGLAVRMLSWRALR